MKNQKSKKPKKEKNFTNIWDAFFSFVYTFITEINRKAFELRGTLQTHCNCKQLVNIIQLPLALHSSCLDCLLCKHHLGFESFQYQYFDNLPHTLTQTGRNAYQASFWVLSTSTLCSRCWVNKKAGVKMG